MLKAALETGQPHKHLFCVSCLQIALGVKPFRPGLLADGARGADWAPPLGGRVGKTVRSPVTARFHPPRSMFAEGKEPSAEDLVPPTPQPCYRHIIRVTSPLARLLMEMVSSQRPMPQNQCAADSFLALPASGWLLVYHPHHHHHVHPCTSGCCLGSLLMHSCGACLSCSDLAQNKNDWASPLCIS